MPPTITLPQSKASGLSLQRSQRAWVERRLNASGNFVTGQKVNKLDGEVVVTGVIALGTAPDAAIKVSPPATSKGVSRENTTIVDITGALDEAPSGGSITVEIVKRDPGETTWTVITDTPLTFADGALEAGMILGSALLDSDAPSGRLFRGNVLTIGPAGNTGKGLSVFIALRVLASLE